MSLSCPQCSSESIRKNGSIHNGKQKYECICCHRQFVEHPENKTIPTETKERIRRSLLERVSLEGICRIFDVSMPWLLDFMTQTIQSLPEDLNTTVISENDDFEVSVLEIDELWSFVGDRSNDQWLWLVLHSKSRQIVAFHVGKRNKASAEALMAKIPADLKKKPGFLQTNSQLTTKLSPGSSTNQSAKNLGRQVTLRDLTVPSDSDALD